MKLEAAERPLEAVRAVERAYPRIWDMAAVARSCKGDPDIGDWPSYCWLPMAGWGTLVRRNAQRMPIAAAVGTWRLSTGIYCYNEDLLKELIRTPIGEQTPTAAFFNLPEYCVYIDTPYNTDYSGMFAHLEYDMSPHLKYSSDGQPHGELRLLYLPRTGDILNNTVPVMLHLSNNSIIGSLREAYASKSEIMLENIDNELSLLLYLCSDCPDLGDREPPQYIEPKIIKGRNKWIPRQKPEVWNVGVRLGASIRHYRQGQSTAQDEDGSITGRTVRPHIRRAHWHGYWTGPKKESSRQKFIYKWIPPIPVNVQSAEDGELPAVVHSVKE